MSDQHFILFFPHLAPHKISKNHSSHENTFWYQFWSNFTGIFLSALKDCGNPLQDCIYLHSLPMRHLSFISIFCTSKLSKNKSHLLREHETDLSFGALKGKENGWILCFFLRRYSYKVLDSWILFWISSHYKETTIS